MKTQRTNQRDAARRSAESRRCPKCGRGSSMMHYSDPMFVGSFCRYDDCDYTTVRLREPEPDTL